MILILSRAFTQCVLSGPLFSPDDSFHFVPHTENNTLGVDTSGPSI
jgi:hypothetical protein